MRSCLLILEKEYYDLFRKTYKKKYPVNAFWNQKKLIDRFSIDKNTAIIILYCRYYESPVKLIQKLLKIHSISRIIFIIEDVLIVKDKNQANFINQIDENYNVNFDEFKYIENIVSKRKFVYEIYHCEADIKNIFKNTVKIKYLDWHTINCKFYDHKQNIKFDTPIIYKLCCFNSRPDCHRVMVASYLSYKPHILLTFLEQNQNVIDFYFKNSYLKIDNFLPQSKLKLQEGVEILKTNTYIYDHKNVNVRLERQNNNLFAHNQSFLSLVTETKYYTVLPNFSEKTIKAIYCYRPFILIAPPKTLELIKSLGFKTFDQWWDESYDDEFDHTIRLEKIFQIIDHILSMSSSNLCKILKEMQKILEFNRNHLDNNLFDSALELSKNL